MTMWDQVASAWAEHADFQEQRAAALTERMLAITDPQPGDRVLELACGAGGTGLAAAPLVAPDGEVVLSDASPEMVAVAAARAAAQTSAAPGLVQTRVLDLQRIEEPDAAFDVVLCREGLMFVGDPAQAAAEIYRVLRPGGRVAVSVWGSPQRNPWLATVFAAVHPSPTRAAGPSVPTGPGPFALAGTQRLTSALQAGGFSDITVDEVDLPMRAPDSDAWWTRTTALAGPLRAALAAMSPQERAATRERATTATAPFRTANGLEMPGLALLATARR